MLNQKYFGLPLWSWLVVIIIGIILYNYNQPRSKNESKSKSIDITKDITKDENKEKFADIINSNENSKIKIFNFNTSWCGWSKRFERPWNKFVKAIESDPKLKNKFEAIDVKCDDSQNESMCDKYDVPGYPYVVVEEINGARTPYNGPRTAKALLALVKNLN